MAGKERGDQYVQDNYLNPYLQFATAFFGRAVGAHEPIDLTDADTRWNLARTMFRLESGRPPVIKRKPFDCGIAFGSDIHADFTKARVEAGSSANIEFAAFKGLEHYTNICAAQAAGTDVAAVEPDATPGSGGTGADTGPGGSDANAEPGGTASDPPAGVPNGSTATPADQPAGSLLSALQAKLNQMETEITSLRQEKRTLAQQLNASGQQIGELGKKLTDLGRQLERLGPAQDEPSHTP
jgi:hypothetical protein